MQKNTLWFNGLSMDDVDKVGGKNASLGEMVSNLSNAGVSVPNGFATTSYAFNQFLDFEGLDLVPKDLNVMSVLILIRRT